MPLSNLERLPEGSTKRCWNSRECRCVSHCLSSADARQSVPVNLRDAYDSVLPSALAMRIKELHRQSQRYQESLTRLQDELDRLQAMIADIGSAKQADASELRSDDDQKTA